MPCLAELESFLHAYPAAYQSRLSEYPRYFTQGEDSLCVMSGDATQASDAVFWQPVKRDEPGNFDNVANALNITLHPDINDFYGHFWTAPCLFHASSGDGELTGVWNAEDFAYLQQNMIGHLMMKQKLRQPLTWFVGLLDDGEKMLTVNNDDGSVWSEVPGEVQQEKLADSLAQYLAQLSPKVAPPVKHEELPMPALEHPGIWSRLKVMWHNLIGKSDR